LNVAADAPKRPALRYYGGKWKLAPWIISHFPEHKSYVEPCGGAASVLLRKPRSKLETYNDLDGNVVNFFQVLRDQPDELIRKIKLTPWARAEYELSAQPCEDSIEQARRFFSLLWMSIGGAISNCTPGTWQNRIYARPDSLILYHSELEKIADRFKQVQIDSRPATNVIKRYDNADALIYFDPPYVQSERSHKNEYITEWTEANHIEAAELLRSAKGYVIVSGYACPLYTELYENHGWERKDKEAQTNSGGKRIESLWLSPRTSEALKEN
jgi:DNA adenine methylase